MKVAVIGWELPPMFSGGLGIHTLNLFTKLSKYVDVELYVPRLGRIHERYAFNVRQVDIGVPVGPSGYAESYDFYEAVRRYNDVVSGIDLNGADIVHCHDWITFNAAMELKRKRGVPMVATVHSTEMDRSGGFFPQRWIMEIERAGLEAADAVIAVSRYTKRLVSELYGIPGEKISVVHNGVGDAFIRLPQRDYAPTGTALYFGRLTSQKGPKFFIEAASKAVQMYREARFIIAGSGELMDELRDMAASSLPEGSYRFTGFVKLEDALRLYSTSDVFVLPAVSEPFGITVLEAMSAGTPTIISRTTGVGESLRNVLRADFWDTDLIAEFMVGIMKYRGLRATMGREGKVEASRFTWDRAAEETLQVYRRVRRW